MQVLQYGMRIQPWEMDSMHFMTVKESPAHITALFYKVCLLKRV